ncbi:MAG: hypothetical protein H0U76_31175 [Ktedonobacteraceae bacterium]|nr:hypothetical protein [Ktedonobacteraceae bacterium]MBA3946753.1 hypothetical protein [Herpetosiphonaceae bacterium]
MDVQLRQRIVRGLISLIIVVAGLTLTGTFKAYALVLYIIILIATGIALMLAIQGLPAYKPRSVLWLVPILVMGGGVMVGLLLARSK